MHESKAHDLPHGSTACAKARSPCWQGLGGPQSHYLLPGSALYDVFCHLTEWVWPRPL